MALIVELHRDTTECFADPSVPEIVRAGGTAQRMGDPGVNPIKEIVG